MHLTQRWLLFSLVLCLSLMVHASRTTVCSAGRPSSAERSYAASSISRQKTDSAKISVAAAKGRAGRVSAQISSGADGGLKLSWDAGNRSADVAGCSDWKSPLLDEVIGSHNISKTRQQTLSKDAALYSDAVNEWSRKFNLKPDLLYAMILTESDFNPRLVSSASAHGLMQVVPDTAGEEVRRWFGGNGLPSSSELFDPYTNIKYGAGYFHLLQKRYFGFVKDPRSREYCAIAAYNSGAGPIMRVFGENRKSVESKLNAMTPDEVLASLLKRVPIKQTRMYLRKVLGSRKYFASTVSDGGSKSLN